MLYHVTFTIDRQAAGFAEREAELTAAQAKRVAEVHNEGRLLGVWRRADCGGSMGVIDSESHDTLVADLKSLPMFPYFRSIEVVPVIPYGSLPKMGRS
jgi:muconolactone delta-isomerase